MHFATAQNEPRVEPAPNTWGLIEPRFGTIVLRQICSQLCEVTRDTTNVPSKMSSTTRHLRSEI